MSPLKKFVSPLPNMKKNLKIAECIHTHVLKHHMKFQAEVLRTKTGMAIWNLKIWRNVDEILTNII